MYATGKTEGVKYQSLRVSLLLLAALFSLFLLLKYTFPDENFSKWLLLSLLILMYEIVEFWRFLPLNKRNQTAETFGNLGIGTHLTLLRGFLIACTGGFLAIQKPEGAALWIPGLIYTLAALFDRFDGYFARRQNHSSILGREIDMRFDALGILVACSLGVHYQQLPMWYLSVGIVYYLFMFDKWRRLRRDISVNQLTESRYRRVLAGMQMGFLAACLWPIFSPPATTLASFLFGIPLLAGFLRDWLIFSGVINPDGGLYRFYYGKISTLIFSGILPAARGLFFVMFIIQLIFWDKLNYTYFTGVLTTDILPGFTFTHVGVSVILAILTVFIATGFFVRLSSLAIIGIVGAYISLEGLSFFVGMELGIAICLLIYGAGEYSVQNPEEVLFIHWAET